MPAPNLSVLVQDTFTQIVRAVETHTLEFGAQEIGTVKYVGHGIARVGGLPGVQAEELIRFESGALGMAFNLDRHQVGVVLFSEPRAIQAGSTVYRTGRVLDVPVGEALLGRVITPTGTPIDQRGAVRTTERRPVERDAPPIMARAPVRTPLQTGIKSVDALIPIGRGQRELILGDRQTGKTALALDTIINQKGQDVICVYCAIGQRSSAVARLIADLQTHQALEYSIVVVAGGQDTPGVQFIAPYAATTIAEYFVEQGRDVLIVYDDLTRHAWAYRELSLLLRRPPGREAYPGDIFYVHSRLLERATQWRSEYGGGSLTALPIAETEAQNISAYIPTNLISITDGQLYLAPDLFQKGILPAVDIGKSVSRVGGKAQLAAYRAVAGDMRLSYAQFEELETFARFGTRLDDETRRTLEHGARVREILKQTQYEPISVTEQIAVMLAVTTGALDAVPLEHIAAVERALRQAVTEQLGETRARIEQGASLADEDRAKLLELIERAVESFLKTNDAAP